MNNKSLNQTTNITPRGTLQPKDQYKHHPKHSELEHNITKLSILTVTNSLHSHTYTPDNMKMIEQTDIH